MANEKIHEYIDSVEIADIKGSQIWIDTDTGDPETNEWLSKKMEMSVLAQILRTYFRVHGQFCSDQMQSITSANTAQQITLNNIMNNNGINMDSNALLISEQGYYRIQCTLIVANSGGQHQHLETWMRIDGNNMAFSKKTIDAHSNQSGTPLVNEMIIQLDANAELTFWMMGSATNLFLKYEAQNSVFPFMPSVSITINKI